MYTVEKLLLDVMGSLVHPCCMEGERDHYEVHSLFLKVVEPREWKGYEALSFLLRTLKTKKECEVILEQITSFIVVTADVNSSVLD
jgi:hypothetical protein